MDPRLRGESGRPVGGPTWVLLGGTGLLDLYAVRYIAELLDLVKVHIAVDVAGVRIEHAGEDERRITTTGIADC